MTTFANIRAYPQAEDKAVIKPDFDTPYLSALLDLRNEPVIVSDPGSRWALLSATHARYVVLRVRVPRLAYNENASSPLSPGGKGLAARSGVALDRGLQAPRGHARS